MHLNDLLEKDRKAATKKMDEHQALALFASALPANDSLNYLDVMMIAPYGYATVTLEIPTRRDLDPIVALFPPANLAAVSNGSFAMIPATHPDAHRGTAIPVAPIYFRLRQWIPGELHREFIWYTDLMVLGKKEKVQVVVRVKDDPAHYEECHRREAIGRGKGFSIVNYEWRAVSLPGTLGMRYDNSHAPKTPPIHLSYWEKECDTEDILNNL